MENLNILIAATVAMVVLTLFFVVFGKGGGRGGVVVSRVTADLRPIDPEFKRCRPEAKYSTFQEGKPHKIDIEIENLPLQPGEVLSFYINRQLLANVEVERDREAEFEHWSDGDVPFPQINAGDQLDVVYQNKAVMSGIFN